MGRNFFLAKQKKNYKLVNILLCIIYNYVMWLSLTKRKLRVDGNACVRKKYSNHP